MITRAPLKSDQPGKCSRWWVKIYNPETHKAEKYTVRGTLKEAQAFERDQKDKLARGIYIARSERKTVNEVLELFLRERRARNRRTSTVKCYESDLNCHVLPKFGEREIGSIRKSDIKNHFYGMREEGKTVATVNRALRAMKALMNFALDSELIDRNVMARFRPFERVKGEKRANRGSFSESEVRSILDAARPGERALIGLLCFTGMRPGEVYALDWQSVDLEAGRAQVRRSWDHRGAKFVDPKTDAGERTVPLSAWVVAQLGEHRATAKETSPESLVFSGLNVYAASGDPPQCEQAFNLHEQGLDRNEIATRLGSTPKRITQLICHERARRQKMAEARRQPAPAGQPLNPSNVRRDIWLPLKKRAKVRNFDLYSLRHTFVVFARAGGAEPFNVARAIGHAKSEIVDTVYGNHTLDSGVAGLSASVTERALGEAALPAEPPTPPSASPVTTRKTPQLRVIEGGGSCTGFVPGRQKQA